MTQGQPITLTLDTQPPGGRLVIDLFDLGVTDSTSGQACRRLAEGWRPPRVAVFTAHSQTAGVGRLGRAWASPPGGLYCSFVAPVPDDGLPPTISLSIGLAVLEAVAAAAPELAPRLRIKWPNDLVALRPDGPARKLAGVLVQRVGPHFVVGVGVNATTDPASLPPDVTRRATSIAAELPGVGFDAPGLRDRLIAAVVPALIAPAGAGLVARVVSLLEPAAGREVAVRLPTGESASGTCLGLGPGGELLLEGGEGRTRAITSGEVAAGG